MEAVGTFILVSTIFGVAVDKKAPKNIFGLGIGIALGCNIMAVGPYTGASFNAARGFGPAIFSEQIGERGQWIYYTATVLGGIIAGVNYHFAFLHEYKFKSASKVLPDDEEIELIKGNIEQKKLK